MKSLIVNPVNTQKSVTGKIETPNIMGNYGLTTKLAEISEQNAIKYSELKDTEQILTSESGILEGVHAGQDFQLGLKTDDNYYKSPDKFNEYEAGFLKRKKDYEDMAKNNGYKEDIINATLNRMNRDFEETKVIYGKYVTDYLKEEDRKHFLLLQDAKDKTISKFMLNRNWGQGVTNYKEYLNSNLAGVKKEQLSMEQAIKLNNHAKTTFLSSDVYSLINESDGLEKLTKYGKMSFNEFNNYYNDLNGQYGDFKAELIYEDYEAWQREIKQAAYMMEVRKKAKEEKTLFDKEKYLKDLRDNPVENALKGFPITTQINEVIEPFTLKATSYKYGEEFKSIEEIVDNGYLPVTIGKVNSKSNQYMDSNIGADIYMGTRMEEVFDYVGGLPVEQQRAILDGQYDDTKFIPGYNGTVLYAKGDTAYRYYYDKIYSAENKKILNDIGEVEGDFISVFKMYQEDSSNGDMRVLTLFPGQMLPNNHTGYKGIYDENGEYSKMSLGGVLAGLKVAGINGDKNAERLYRDCEELIKDTIILGVVNEEGGILSKDLAKKLELEEHINEPIQNLGKKEKQKIFDYYLKEPGTIKKLFGGENNIKKQVREQLTSAISEMTAEIQTIDIGYGNILNIRKELKGEEIAKGIRAVIQEKDFLTKEGLIVPKKKIKIVGRTGTDDVLLYYNNEPLYNNKGERAYINIGGIVNE